MHSDAVCACAVQLHGDLLRAAHGPGPVHPDCSSLCAGDGNGHVLPNGAQVRRERDSGSDVLPSHDLLPGHDLLLRRQSWTVPQEPRPRRVRQLRLRLQLTDPRVTVW